MKTEIDHEFLSQVYLRVKKHTGWLAGVIKSFRLNKEESDYMEKLASIEFDLRMPTLVETPGKKQFYGKVEDNGRTIDLWEKQILQDRRWGIDQCETNEEKVRILSQQIDLDKHQEEGMLKRGTAYPWIRLVVGLSERKDKELLRDKLKPAQPSLAPQEPGRLEDAKNYPLEKLLSVEPGTKILCPFHSDTKPSAWVKNGFGYCFSCGESFDSIKYLMKTQSMSFPGAVKYLGGK